MFSHAPMGMSKINDFLVYVYGSGPGVPLVRASSCRYWRSPRTVFGSTRLIVPSSHGVPMGSTRTANGVGVAVGGVPVAVGVLVNVGVTVAVGVLVGVRVGVAVGVLVLVGVLVGPPGV